MIAVGTGLHDGVDDATGRAAVFRGVAGRLDLNLGQEIGVHRFARHARAHVGGVHAVDDEAVLRAAGTIDLKAAVAALIVGARRGGQRAREVAAARNALQQVLRDARRGRVLLGIDDRRRRRHLDILAHAANFEIEVDLQDLAEQQLDVLERELLEAGHVRGDAVASRTQRGKPVLAGLVADGRYNAPRASPRFDCDTRQHRAGAVLDDAFDRAGYLLR